MKRGDGGEMTSRFITIIPVGAFFSDGVDLITSFPFCASGMSIIILYLEMSRFINFLKKAAPNLSLILGIILIGWLVNLKQCRVEERYGFSAGTPYIGQIIDRCEVLMVNSVRKGGAFYRAGFRSGDVLINTEFNWVNRYIGSFDLPPGTVFYVKTIPGGDRAKNRDELSRMPRITRKVVAPLLYRILPPSRLRKNGHSK
jgi:hypothetical protein